MPPPPTTEIRNFVHTYLQGHLKKVHGLTWEAYVCKVKHNAKASTAGKHPMPYSGTGDVPSTSDPTEKAPALNTSSSPKVTDISEESLKSLLINMKGSKRAIMKLKDDLMASCDDGFRVSRCWLKSITSEKTPTEQRERLFYLASEIVQASQKLSRVSFLDRFEESVGMSLNFITNIERVVKKCFSIWEKARVFPCATISRWRNEFDTSVSQIQAGGPKRRKPNTEDIPCSSSSSTCEVLTN